VRGPAIIVAVRGGCRRSDLRRPAKGVGLDAVEGATGLAGGCATGARPPVQDGVTRWRGRGGERVGAPSRGGLGAVGELMGRLVCYGLSLSPGIGGRPPGFSADPTRDRRRDRPQQ
jgi:hypothetical protein